MKLLIIEKPSMLNMLRGHITIDESVDIVYTYGFGLWVNKIPKINFDQVPYTEKPTELYPRSTNTDYCTRFMHNGANEDLVVAHKSDSKEDIIHRLDELIDTIKSRLSCYDEIILMPDADQTGAWAVKQIFDQLPKEDLPPVHALLLNAGLDPKSIQKAVEGRFDNVYGQNSFVDVLAERHKVKKYFDFWWYTNSQKVFSELCKWSGLKSDVLISKYEFMLINIMSQQSKPLHEYKIYRLMEKWKGTGKYNSLDFWNQVGSAASRREILKNAMERGALEIINIGGEELIVLSEKGRAFLSRVHKKSFDPDLSFRIDEWCQNNDLKAARRYISTFFRRQFRYQRKQLKCSYISNEIIMHLTRTHSLSSVLIKNEEDDSCKDAFYLRTADHKNAGIVTVEALQSGFYKVALQYKDEIYSDLVKDVKSLEPGLLTPSGWVKKFGAKGIHPQCNFEDIPF